jgi:hypothetical protein
MLGAKLNKANPVGTSVAFLPATLMNIANALVFVYLGTVMQVLPLLGVGAMDANLASHGASALWLQVMGLVTGGIGGSYLLREAGRESWVYAQRVLARRAEARALAAQGVRQAAPVGVRVSF